MVRMSIMKNKTRILKTIVVSIIIFGFIYGMGSFIYDVLGYFDKEKSTKPIQSKVKITDHPPFHIQKS